MPLATDALDLIIVSSDPWIAPDPDRVAALLDDWQALGALADGPGSSGHGPLRRPAGPRAELLLPGGFGVLWLDRPEGPTLYANQLGGFRVPCPVCGAPLARPFGQAMQALRRGQVEPVRCPACGARSPLQDIALQPPGFLARGALVFGDARGLSLTPQAMAQVAQALGTDLRLVLRRRV